MEPDATKSWIPLPDDVLSDIIFTYIPMCQWSSCLEYVSKQFENCVLIAYGRMKSINFCKLYSLTLSEKSWGMASSLLFSEETATSARLNDILNKLLLVCPNLIEMDGFEYVSRTTDVETWDILKQFHGLRSISLNCCRRGIPFPHFADFVASCRSLKNLSVTFLDYHGRCFDVVGTLDVGSITTLTIPEMFPLENISDKLTSLTIREIGSSFKSDWDKEKAIKMLNNLEYFSVDIGTNNSYKILLYDVLPNLCKLTKLSVSASLVHFDIEFCVQLDAIKSQLQLVKINGGSFSNEVENFLFTECLNLRTLLIASDPTDDALQNVRNLPGNLKELGFCELEFPLLPLLLPSLVKLSNFTDLTIISSDCPVEWENISCLNNLKNLRLDGHHVNDSLLEKWDKKNDKMFERLISLKIRWCRGVSDIGGCLLAKKAINLKILDLCEARISDKTISILADVAKKLTTVYLVQGDPYLYDENAILDFVKKAVCLKKLTLDVKLATKVVRHNDFFPFAECVEILPVFLLQL